MRTLETSRLILRDWTADDIGCEVFDTNTIQYLLSAKNNYAVVFERERSRNRYNRTERRCGRDHRCTLLSLPYR